MNRDLDDLVSKLTANPWERMFSPYSALSHFYQPPEDHDMQNTKDVTDLILCGARSVGLAIRVIETTKPETLVHQVALSVLDGWGAKITAMVHAETPAAPPVEKAVLRWPLAAPKVLRLPAVYRENYYHVREDTYAMGPNRVAADVPLTPDHQLVLDEEDMATEWSESGQCWYLRMSITNKNHERHNGGCWVLSKYIVPGGEIPKPQEK